MPDLSSFHGSGSVLRDAVRQTRKVIREIDDLFTNGLRTRPDFDSAKLGNKVIVMLENEGRTLRVKSAIPGNDRQWVGPATDKAEVWSRFKRFKTSLEKDRFLDYVYNFKYVLFDTASGAFRAIDSDEVAALTVEPTKVPLAVRVMAGR